MKKIRKPKAMLKVVVYRTKPASGGRFRWRLRSMNGEDIARSSEGYVRKKDCLTSLGLVVDGFASNRFELSDLTGTPFNPPWQCQEPHEHR